MKKGVILFHNNIKKIYKDYWVEKCVNSIINQTDNDVTFYEIKLHLFSSFYFLISLWFLSKANNFFSKGKDHDSG